MRSRIGGVGGGECLLWTTAQLPRAESCSQDSVSETSLMEIIMEGAWKTDGSPDHCPARYGLGSGNLYR